ncbi:MAG: L-lactate dehydrogenase complex protein LldE [Bacteroidia bacterium]|jgi:L-lactate dehydrogenase complex protein LldE
MNNNDRDVQSPGPRVSLFVTCLADLFRPSVAFASLQLLERAGCDVSVPLKQTCCGQPAYNAGDFQATIPLAKNVVALLEDADYVVIPSGSCAGMISHHYPNLLEGEWRERAIAVAAKTFELTSFLTEVVTLEPGTGANIGQVAYHDSCAGLRELSIREQPRELLQSLCSAQVSELELRDVCCGFGGTFCAKMPQISSKMTDDKLKDVLDTGAPLLTGGDLGCLMTIAGRASRLGQDIEVRHVAELLAGNLDGPAIGEGD